MQITFNPYKIAHPTYTIVKYRTQDVAYRTINDKPYRIQACCLQGQHNSLAAEGKETASKKCCSKHSPISPINQKIQNRIHTLQNVRASVATSIKKNTRFVTNELVSDMKWPIRGEALTIRIARRKCIFVG